MRKLRKPEEKPIPAERIERKTIDGKDIQLGRVEAAMLAGSAICTGGLAAGSYLKEPHRFVVPKTYDDLASKLRGIRVTKEESKGSYRCRRCKAFMGCRTCAGAIEDLVCSVCRDWANTIAEQVHGKMIPPELASHGLKLINMMVLGKLDYNGFLKLWTDALKSPKTATTGEGSSIDATIQALAENKQMAPLPVEENEEGLEAARLRRQQLREQANKLSNDRNQEEKA